MGYRVLIVDDSPILRAVIRRAVVQAGIAEDDVREAADGEQALAALASDRVDLVLLDLSMPVMDGVAFVAEQRAREELADVAIVAVTTEANQRRLQDLRELGVTRFLRKPFAPEELRGIVAELRGTDG